MASLHSILEAAKSLSLEERTQLVQSLVEMDCPEEHAWEPEFVAEIERRSREYHEGNASLMTWDDLKTKAWERLDGDVAR
jgi:putative addiction module component (TIGR02574 family)